MSSQILLSGGDKWYSYSGEVFGDVSAPATIPMIKIDNTGLRDSMVVIQPFYSEPVTRANASQLGITVKLDNIIIFTSQRGADNNYGAVENTFNLFVPRNSKLEVISLNTSGNNTQERGVNLIGYYL